MNNLYTDYIKILIVKRKEILLKNATSYLHIKMNQ